MTFVKHVLARITTKKIELITLKQIEKEEGKKPMGSQIRPFL